MTRSVPLLFAAFVATLATAQPPARADEVGVIREFREWAISCDQHRACRAMAMPAEAGPGGTIVIDRAGRGRDAPVVTLHLPDEPPARGARLVVAVDDRRVLSGVVGTDLSLAAEDAPGVLRVASATHVARLIGAVRTGARLTVSRDGATEPLLTASLDGAAASFLFMDERQRRLGTRTALVRRGERDPASIPAPIAPRVPPATPTYAYEPVPEAVVTAARTRHLADAEDCAESDDNDMPRARSHRLSGRHALVIVLCSRGAYQYSWSHYIVDLAAPHAVRPADFTIPLDPTSTDHAHYVAFGRTLIDSEFERDTSTLSFFARGRGPADCGTRGFFRWNGETFVAAEIFTMPRCRGLLGDPWLPLARVE